MRLTYRKHSATSATRQGSHVENGQDIGMAISRVLTPCVSCTNLVGFAAVQLPQIVSESAEVESLDEEQWDKNIYGHKPRVFRFSKDGFREKHKPKINHLIFAMA